MPPGNNPRVPAFRSLRWPLVTQQPPSLTPYAPSLSHLLFYLPRTFEAHNCWFTHKNESSFRLYTYMLLLLLLILDYYHFCVFFWNGHVPNAHAGFRCCNCIGLCLLRGLELGFSKLAKTYIIQGVPDIVAPALYILSVSSVLVLVTVYWVNVLFLR